MARSKQTVIQRDFSLGEIREDFLEADDLEMRRQSLRKASNMRVLATRAMEARFGSFLVREMAGAVSVTEIQPTGTLRFGVVVGHDFLLVINEEGSILFSVNPAPWTPGANVWVTPFREQTILGSGCGGCGLWTLRLVAGVWSLDPFAFDARPGGEVAQPYWVYEKGVTIQPSARQGTVTITASAPIFRDEHVGTRIRYGRREIQITARSTASSITGTVIRTLPPSFNITVESGAEFAVGEAVIATETNFQGIITAIAGNVLSVFTLEFFDGPDNDELLTGTTAASKVTGKAEVSPLATTVWDEQLMSPARGWPRSASAAAGRLFFVDFPNAPSVIVASSTRGPNDFAVGAADDDAIAREAGDGAPRFLHTISAGDVIILSDRGCYYLPTRDGGVLTPSNFQTILFDDRGCNEVRPVRVEDGVVFVESSGETIAAALLDGNIYLKWSVRSLTVLHNHLIRKPKALCGPSLNAASPEKYLFVVNEDGTLATVSWGTSIREETAGFIPWVTDGEYVSISPAFGSYWALVDRDADGPVRYLERFDTEAYLDAALLASEAGAQVPLAVNGDDLDVNGSPLIVQVAYAAFANQTMTGYQNGWHIPEITFNSEGIPVGDIVLDGQTQIGRNYIAKASPWPVELIESPRVGFIKARVIRMSVSVQHTLGFHVQTNGTQRVVGSYNFGDDLSEPPEARTKVYRFTIFGSRDHPEMEVSKQEPGPFRVLAIGQEVQA